MTGKRVCLISLGCPKNLVDSEHVLWVLEREGAEIVTQPEDANVIIINTCGFLEDAVKEAIEHILRATSLNQGGGKRSVIAMGCMVQRYGRRLRDLIPEVDAWFGVGQARAIGDYILGKTVDRRVFLAHPRPLSYLQRRIPCTPSYSSYLKISEGCSNRCTFCLIPRLRGRLVSYPIKELVEEVRRLVDTRPLVELILIAQDLTHYGKDLDMKNGLLRLLEEILKVQGPKWIRLMYMNPWGVTPELLSMIEGEERICPYMDIPIQHIDPQILGLMGRQGPQGIFSLLESIRSLKREIAIRTSLMVGFPTESEEQFQRLYEFTKEEGFRHLGVFAFSPEKGTRAERLRPRVTRALANRRKERLLRLQAGISRKRNKALVGKHTSVLLEGTHPETDLLLVGRAPDMAPEIDGQVIINRGYADVGQIVEVKITDAFEYDLVGEIVG